MILCGYFKELVFNQKQKKCNKDFFGTGKPEQFLLFFFEERLNFKI